MKFNPSVLFSLVAGFVLFISAAQAGPVASTWYDLEKDTNGILNQEIRITGKRGESVVLKKGENFHLNDIISLDGVSVMLYIFEQKNCKHPDAEAEMIIVLPSESPAKADVGLTVKKNCLIEVFAEMKDLMKPSLFEVKPTP